MKKKTIKMPGIDVELFIQRHALYIKHSQSTERAIAYVEETLKAFPTVKNRVKEVIMND